jgi:hypothetical protein
MKVILALGAKVNVDGARRKVPVFGLLKRGGKVYAVVIADGQSHINGIENFWNQAK